MAGLPSWFQFSGDAGIAFPAVSFRGSFGATHCCTQTSPQGPIAQLPEAMIDLKYGRVELATLCPVDWRTRCRLEHLQEGLGIFHSADAVEEHDTRHRYGGLSRQYLLHVQHQQDLAIAQQCRPGIAACPRQQPLHRLEHHIQAVADRVDLEGGYPAGQLP